MAIHAQKQLRSVLAFALAILAGTLIVRNFALSGSSQRTAATQVDLTAARVTAHRFNHDASGLIDLSPRLEYLRLVERTHIRAPDETYSKWKLRTYVRRSSIETTPSNRNCRRPLYPFLFP